MLVVAAQPGVMGICPKCGNAVQSITVTGPGERLLAPCGDVIPTGMDLKDKGCDEQASE